MLPDSQKITTRDQLAKYLKIEMQFYECSIVQRLFCLSEKAILRKHQIFLRKTEYYTNVHNFVISTWYRIRLYRIQNRYSLHVPINCCESGLHIMHLGPILINSKATIGKNCSLHINTALVANGVTDEAPHIGDNVVIGIGAIVIGPVYLADCVAVGANALVNKSVNEQNIAIAGVPAKKISNNGSLEWNKKE